MNTEYIYKKQESGDKILKFMYDNVLNHDEVSSYFTQVKTESKRNTKSKLTGQKLKT